VTDASGRVTFDSIVPGWELGSVGTPIVANRVPPHIHIKVFYGHKVVTTTFYLPDATIDRLYAEVDPYRSRQWMRAPGLDRDYERPHNNPGARILDLERQGPGFVARATVGLADSMGVVAPPLFR
jgi:protocatechuate 3,4-dioxygenase beta subunit